MTMRKLTRVVNATPTTDGAGVKISRIAGFSVPDLEPFLMLDEIKSADRNDFVAGFPDHPHRGIETLTYMKQGGFEHRDHLGHVGSIRSGGAQWMSAGRGIIHSETPLPEAQAMHGFQIWINLPGKDKLKPAEWLDAQPETIPELTTAGGKLRAVTGHWTVNGQSMTSPLTSLTQEASLLDVELSAGEEVILDTNGQHQLAVFVYKGRLDSTIGLQRQQLGIFGPGTQLHLTAGDSGLGALVLSGQPIGEPVAHYGPFVMNTTEELQQAMHDYQTGQLTG
ncbi:nuclease PIN [Hahella sp. CCB-MM4]|uniref:pirin family protein n=1 Tax=Hahella sp. (strain CCB-MM4) TaxID=1926491 RepID=UPI000B9ABBE7|nr:pirin family protein [Hahella sp. CCB-MM4]OZG74673.1 nuclease PIN [Hahella sp. CCB-MM4]